MKKRPAIDNIIQEKMFFAILAKNLRFSDQDFYGIFQLRIANFRPKLFNHNSSIFRIFTPIPFRKFGPFGVEIFDPIRSQIRMIEVVKIGSESDTGFSPIRDAHFFKNLVKN